MFGSFCYGTSQSPVKGRTLFSRTLGTARSQAVSLLHEYREDVVHILADSVWSQQRRKKTAL